MNKFLISLLALFCASSALGSTATKPKLVVNIVVDGMRYDYLLHFDRGFSDNGFRRLKTEGSLCERAMYGYLSTNTASGLATITTGASPSSHGVIGNHWFNYTTGEMVPLTLDKSVRTVGADELDAQVSPRAMIAGTIGDCIKSTSPDSKVVSIAFEPNSAVISGGFTTDAAYWVSPRDGKMVSSTYYLAKLPEWVDKFNEQNLAEAYSAARWAVCRPAGSYYNVLRKDITTDTSALTFDFLMRKKYDYERLKSSPAGNSLLKDFAVQAIINENLGKDSSTDFISIVFNSTRLAGERYGTTSMEVEDVYYRLDMELAALIDFLVQKVGKDNLLLVLSSTHGQADPVIESSRMPAGKFNAEQFEVLINGFLSAQLAQKIPIAKLEQLSVSRWVLDFSNNQLYLNRQKIYQAGLSIAEVQNMVADFAIQFRGVAQAITASTMQSNYFVAGVMGRAQRSYFSRHSGDVVINLLPGWIVESDKLSDSGSPYTYDIHVPLFFYGGGITTDNISREIDVEDVAPTIAHIVGVAPPTASTGKPITELYEKQ